MTKCPYCAGEVQPDAKKCKHCGEWLVPTVSSNILVNVVLIFLLSIFFGSVIGGLFFQSGGLGVQFVLSVIFFALGLLYLGVVINLEKKRR